MLYQCWVPHPRRAFVFAPRGGIPQPSIARHEITRSESQRGESLVRQINTVILSERSESKDLRFRDVDQEKHGVQSAVPIAPHAFLFPVPYSLFPVLRNSTNPGPILSAHCTGAR